MSRVTRSRGCGPSAHTVVPGRTGLALLLPLEVRYIAEGTRGTRVLGGELGPVGTKMPGGTSKTRDLDSSGSTGTGFACRAHGALLRGREVVVVGEGPCRALVIRVCGFVGSQRAVVSGSAHLVRLCEGDGRAGETCHAGLTVVQVVLS